MRVQYDWLNDRNWQGYRPSSPSSSPTSSAFPASNSSTLTNLRYQRSYSRLALPSFVARPLSKPWTRKQQPAMAINDERLVVAAGNTIYSYSFGVSNSRGGGGGGISSPPVYLEGSFSIPGTGHERIGNTPASDWDITALAFVRKILVCGFRNGFVARVVLHSNGSSSLLTPEIEYVPPALNAGIMNPAVETRVNVPRTADLIECVSSSGSDSLYAALSSRGKVYLGNIPSSSSGDNNTNDPTPLVQILDLASRSWCSYLSTEASSPFVALGSSSSTPLVVYSLLDVKGDSITSASINPSSHIHVPTAILSSSRSTTAQGTGGAGGAGAGFGSAVYGICRAPPCSPWGPHRRSSDSTRSMGGTSSSLSSTSSLTSASTPPAVLAPLAPVLTLSDPWSIDPIYSVSSGGGGGAHVAAGSARHSVVSFWDLRYANPDSNAKGVWGHVDVDGDGDHEGARDGDRGVGGGGGGGGGGWRNRTSNNGSESGSRSKSSGPVGNGWSVYAPGNDPSPVYTILMESSRVFGATDTRAFVYDFGPNVMQDTYPALSGSSIAGLKPRRSKIGSSGTGGEVGYYVTRYSHGHGGLIGDH
ncbi:hypothetical protein D9757_008454 [Collybiopsis confluens]|uniref:Uncharacterized protein n=1 Tax=Collybiopsis confluens TaxID=2823264 RepID=A0A8H5HFF7_9AGAR|nr:hypothetical protein D9757_008454 [Collybiopsis confluens]